MEIKIFCSLLILTIAARENLGSNCPKVHPCVIPPRFDKSYHCFSDDSCFEGYKCCTQGCFVHKVCLEPQDNLGRVISAPPIPSTTKTNEITTTFSPSKVTTTTELPTTVFNIDNFICEDFISNDVSSTYCPPVQSCALNITQEKLRCRSDENCCLGLKCCPHGCFTHSTCAIPINKYGATVAPPTRASSRSTQSSTEIYKNDSTTLPTTKVDVTNSFYDNDDEDNTTPNIYNGSGSGHTSIEGSVESTSSASKPRHSDDDEILTFGPDDGSGSGQTSTDSTVESTQLPSVVTQTSSDFIIDNEGDVAISTPEGRTSLSTANDNLLENSTFDDVFTEENIEMPETTWTTLKPFVNTVPTAANFDKEASGSSSIYDDDDGEDEDDGDVTTEIITTIFRNEVSTLSSEVDTTKLPTASTIHHEEDFTILEQEVETAGNFSTNDDNDTVDKDVTITPTSFPTSGYKTTDTTGLPDPLSTVNYQEDLIVIREDGKITTESHETTTAEVVETSGDYPTDDDEVTIEETKSNKNLSLSTVTTEVSDPTSTVKGDFTTTGRIFTEPREVTTPELLEASGDFPTDDDDGIVEEMKSNKNLSLSTTLRTEVPDATSTVKSDFTAMGRIFTESREVTTPEFVEASGDFLIDGTIDERVTVTNKKNSKATDTTKLLDTSTIKSEDVISIDEDVEVSTKSRETTTPEVAEASGDSPTDDDDDSIEGSGMIRNNNLSFIAPNSV